jgi:CheY-like chemotaxis protein
MPSTQPAGKTLLVVEDDAITRSALMMILSDEGYRVTACANGQEALEHLREAPRPDLILLDLRMPVMDGWEFHQAQTRDPDLNTIPVLVLTAERDPSSQTAAMNVAGILHKPIDPRELLDIIGRHCC